MTLRQATQSGRETIFSGGTKYNLITQDPESIGSTPAGLPTTGTVAATAVGHEFTLVGRMGIDGNAPDAATTYTVNLFAKDAPYKFRVLEIRFEVIDLTVGDFTDGDGGNLDITVQDGDGASSEAFTDVLADQALDDDYANGTGTGYPTSAVALTNTTIAAGESLRASLIVEPDSVGATNDGALVDVIIRCLRVE